MRRYRGLWLFVVAAFLAQPGASSASAVTRPSNAIDTPEGRTALERRAKEGDAVAAYELGYWYTARTLRTDIGDANVAAVEPALYFLRQAAEAGHREATVMLIVTRYRRASPRVVERVRSLMGEDERRRWLRRGVDLGVPSATCVLGHSLVMLDSTPSQVAEGLESLRRGEANGDVSCRRFLAEAYGSGRGVERDDAEALRLWLLVAEADLPARERAIAERNAGTLLHNGVPGRPADQVAALAMFRRAAGRGDAWSMRTLGVYHESGFGGLQRSPAEALAWYRRAAASEGLDENRREQVAGAIRRVETAIARAGAAPATAATPAAPTAPRPATAASPRPAPPQAAARPAAAAGASGRSTACNLADGGPADALAFAQSLADVRTWECEWKLYLTGYDIEASLGRAQSMARVEGGVIYRMGGTKWADTLRLVRSFRSGASLVHEFSAMCYPEFASGSVGNIGRPGVPGRVTASSGFRGNSRDHSVEAYPVLEICGSRVMLGVARFSGGLPPP